MKNNFVSVYLNYNYYVFNSFTNTGILMATIDEQMVKIFRQAQAQMLDEFMLAIEQWKNLTVIQAKLNAITFELTNQYKNFQTVVAQEEYLLGWKYYNNEIEKRVKDIQKLPLQERLALWWWMVADLWWVHTEAVKNLITAWNNYLEETIQGIRKGILWQFNEYQTIKTFETIWQGMIQGDTLTKMKQAFIKNTVDSFPYFKDKAGRKRTLERYWEMLIRTETWKAYNTWILNQWIEAGVKKYRRNERADCCPLCIPHKSEVRNVYKKWFPPLLYHPNCRGFREPIL